MSFRISKASSFLILIVRLYLRFCSPLIFLLFDIIELAKWILLLQFSFSSVNDYSMKFTREHKPLLSLIQWKADDKLLKQHLLDFFWWYFITGAAGWNSSFLVIFALPIGTPNIWNIFESSSLNLVRYSFYRNLVHMPWTNTDLVGLSTMHCCVKCSKRNGYGVPNLNTMINFAKQSRFSSYIYT